MVNNWKIVKVIWTLYLGWVALVYRSNETGQRKTSHRKLVIHKHVKLAIKTCHNNYLSWKTCSSVTGLNSRQFWLISERPADATERGGLKSWDKNVLKIVAWSSAPCIWIVIRNYHIKTIRFSRISLIITFSVALEDTQNKLISLECIMKL